MTPLLITPPHPPVHPAILEDTIAVVLAAQRAAQPDQTPAQQQARRDLAVGMIESLGARNALEATHAATATAAFYGAAECFRRAILPGTPDNAAIRWHGKAIALNHLRMQMIRELERCHSAPSDKTPQSQSRPAAPPDPPPQPARAETAQSAPAAPANASGRRDPMPSERPSPAPLPDQAGRPARPETAQTPTAAPANAFGTRNPMPSERPPPAPLPPRAVQPARAAPAVSPTPPRTSVRADLLGSTSLPGDRTAAMPWHPETEAAAPAGAGFPARVGTEKPHAQ